VPTVLRGARPPETLRVTIVNPPGATQTPLDLTSVTAVRLVFEDEAVPEWTTAIVTQTTTLLVVHHVFQAGDVDVARNRRVNVMLDGPFGQRRAQRFSLDVV
jgi:hypothetical protein